MVSNTGLTKGLTTALVAEIAELLVVLQNNELTVSVGAFLSKLDGFGGG